MPTTIQVDRRTKERLNTFGMKGETYQDIINRLYDTAVQQQLHDLLMSSKNTLSLGEARKRHAQRWHA